ncbi:MAG: DnaJ domain-containing protein [Dehalococcoidia bacterium]
MAAELRFTKPVFKDYYLILQVHPEADGAMVEAAYWHLARRYSDAALEDPSAKRKLDDLNEAYSVLGSSAPRDGYDRLRADALGEGTLPIPPPTPSAPQPLAIMERERARPREDTSEEKPSSGFRLPAFHVPAWQNALAALVIIMLGVAGLAAQLPPAFVGALLFVGLSLTAIPLVRRVPRSAPSFTLPSPKLPARRRSRASEPSGRGDSEQLRRSTEAMVARLRVGQESLSLPKRSQDGGPPALRDPVVAGAEAPTLLNRVD